MCFSLHTSALSHGVPPKGCRAILADEAGAALMGSGKVPLRPSACPACTSTHSVTKRMQAETAIGSGTFPRQSLSFQCKPEAGGVTALPCLTS
ncbi:hypothetical protein NDU88_001222 [Pleurodeles waltl]|uniref:Uncharacterized protein n=1 Tax=Pleurodeles waltl TaxID=8319 RepID=A0AAV7VZF9_PLEWA|nr:hypothetical protein NDU88_001222 [Pleurodeles waltl]